MATLPPQQFCVRWNSYHTNLQSVFPRLLLTEQFADVTLACESKALRCHKLVLSACSAYLEKLLLQNPCKHPIVLMRDMRFSEMQALVDFMYKGEVNVTQDELPSLLKSAEALQIRGLCSSDTGGLTQELNKTDASFAVASDALVANANRENSNEPSPPHTTPSSSPQTNGNGSKKRKSTTPEVKEETVEEDGLYYGELENEPLEYNEDDEPSKPGSSLGQTSDDFAISNVQCHYDSASESEDRVPPPNDHNYGLRDEPPAFIIQSVGGSAYVSSPGSQPCMEVSPRVVLTPAYNFLPIRDNNAMADNNINKRIRRSEVELSRAADCVSRGSTFQTVSEQFNIPISTIRFFMARKGILPRRRRGRTSHISTSRQSCSPEPPYHMQHYKLPDTIAIKGDDDD